MVSNLNSSAFRANSQDSDNTLTHLLTTVQALQIHTPEYATYHRLGIRLPCYRLRCRLLLGREFRTLGGLIIGFGRADTMYSP